MLHKLEVICGATSYASVGFKVDLVASLIAEVRSTRAAQLTPGEVEALRYDIRELSSIAKDWTAERSTKVTARIDECRERALAALDRLYGIGATP